MRSADYLAWKMRNDPWGSSALFVEVDSRIVGFLLNMHRHLLVQGTERVARDGADLAIDPEMQGRGLYRQIGAYADHTVDLGFDLTVRYDTHGASIHLGPERGVRPFANQLAVLWAPVDIHRVTGRRPLDPRGEGPRLYARRVAAAVNRFLHPAGRATWAISTIDRFDERIDAFCEAASRLFVLVHRRTAASLNWRYCDPNGGRFTVRLAEEGERVLGYTTLAERGSTGYIADILALPGRLDVARALVADALRLLREAGVASVYARLQTVHPYQPAFRLLGFAPRPETCGLVYRPSRLDARALSFLDDPRAAVHITLGDSDHI